MSKQRFKSLRKYEYDDEYEVDTRDVKDKRKERRFERALRTRNIRDLVEDDNVDEDLDWEIENRAR